ncbi:hypothetical protein MKW98_011912 [Papaver atlanticum]|uniref:BTB domain-containing protein n=1 Tax=Papaver atlanticum TaxID=357466 RepID=A0AAD4XP22_9MAGN|nr:hypothetical protein MKW98_011912 [Papaver atlanticum]
MDHKPYNRIEYFGGLASTFKEESYSDIQVKPGNGPSIPAHKFMLLSTNTCKDSICSPEFNHEELATFLELLYCGNLAKEKFEMHYYCLALASHE